MLEKAHNVNAKLVYSTQSHNDLQFLGVAERRLYNLLFVEFTRFATGRERARHLLAVTDARRVPR